MGAATMGRVLVKAKIESLADLYEAQKGARQLTDVRSIEIDDALIDTGATMLSLPSRYVQQLGLVQTRTRRARTPAGVKDFGIYSSVRLTVQGRDCDVEVSELPDDCPILIGQVPLELLDFVVDPVGQRLIGNPAHGGEQMMDMF
jgi:predicted aspartyl protease